MKKLIQEFKAFAIKGNVIDLATAVIVGGAFGKIVSSLVADIIMPIIGLLSGGSDFKAWKILLRPEKISADGEIIQTALNLNAGLFLQNIIDFLIIAFSVFLMIKALIGVKKHFQKEVEQPKEIKEEKTSPEAKLLQEIKDILQQQKRAD